MVRRADDYPVSYTHLVGLRITGQTVVRIIDCDEANAELRKNLLNIASAVDIVS